MKMDFRKALYWARLARIREMKRKIVMAQCSRAAMTDNAGYEAFLGDISGELSMLIRGSEKVIQDNWEAIRILAKKRAKR